MNKKTALLIVVLLALASFLAGSVAARKRYENVANLGQKPTAVPQASQPTPVPFEAKKSDKPEVKFFVMSFCPYGNQAEEGLEPAYQLLKDKVSWVPRYIVNDKKTSCERRCSYRVYNDETKKRCEDAVAQGQVEDMETCQGYFPYQSVEDCLGQECASIKTGEYESLHGVQELSQNVREICALAQTQVASSINAMDRWWQFVSLVNKNCTDKDADTCWTKQAQEAGLNTAQIDSCAKTGMKNFLDKEIAEAEKYQVTSSPTVLINEVLYNQGRSPEDYKKAICDSFNSPPEECSQVLSQESQEASGGCN